MKIAVRPENAAKIEKALKEANGTAESHTYTTYAEVSKVAEQAESVLIKLSIPQAKRSGAQVTSTSSFPMPKCYKYARKGTRITLVRGSADWFLTSVTATELWPNQGGGRRLLLTAEQDAIVVSALRSQYGVKL